MAASDLSYRQALRNRRLTVLLGGDVVSKVGDGMLLVALPLQTLRTYDGEQPAIALGLVTAAPFVLAVAVSLVFGLGRRRFDPRTVVVADGALRAAVLGAVGVLALGDALPLEALAGALLIGSALRLIAASGRRLLATDMGGARGRFAVNGLLGTSDSLALFIVGPALGGALSAAFSPGLVLLLSGVSCLALLTAVLVTVPPTVPSDRDPVGPASGWRVLRSVPVAAWLFGVVFAFNLFYMPVEIALPLLVRGPLEGSAAALGAIWTSFGVGALIGAVATDRLRRLPQEVLLVGIIASWAACVGLLALARDVPSAAVAMGLGGLVYAPFTPVAYSLMQRHLRPDQQQPVITLWAAGTLLAAPVGLLLGGPVVELTGIRGGLVVSLVLTAALVPAAARGLTTARSPAPPRESP